MKRDLFWVKTTKQSKAGGQDEIAKGKVTIITLVIRSSTVSVFVDILIQITTPILSDEEPCPVQ